MKKITTMLTLIFMGAISTLSAQLGLYEALEQNGMDAEYKEFYHISKGEKEGTTKISGDRYWVKPSIDVAENGVRTGFTLTKTDGSGEFGISLLYRDKEAKGYPNVSFIYDNYKMTGYIVVGDYIMELEGISEDGLSFKEIDRVFVKKQVKEEKEAKGEEQKKGGKFAAGLKKFAAASVGLGPDGGGMTPELKKASNEDLFKIATDYLKAMKAKQNAYTLTSADKAELEKVKTLLNEKYTKINKANADYWNSEQGKKVAKSYSDDKGSATEYTIKNTTGATVYVGHNGASTILYNGSTQSVRCGSPIYIMKTVNSRTEQGSQISDGQNVCGKTITF